MSACSADVATAFSEEHVLPNPIPGEPHAAMSVDVEDWFHVENLKAVIPRSTWEGRERRVEANTMRLLDLLDQHGGRSTFFVLGWVADRHPTLIRRIADAGHEIASHGYGHELVYTLSRAEFRADVERSKKVIEDASGHPVTGYRAPCFSITDWAVDILQELGFEYDSSLFPAAAHDRYGRLTGVGVGQTVVELRSGFHEVCISCLRLAGRGLPWGGGGYFRLVPFAAWRAGVRRILRSGSPYIFYIHPWEIDPGQPRMPGLSRISRFRHYLNLDACEQRFGNLLSEFSWTTIRDVLAGWTNRVSLAS